MTHQKVQWHDPEVRKAIRTGQKISVMVQGTMGLEGQGLDRKSLHTLKNKTIRRLLADRRQRTNMG